MQLRFVGTAPVLLRLDVIYSGITRVEYRSATNAPGRYLFGATFRRTKLAQSRPRLTEPPLEIVVTTAPERVIHIPVLGFVVDRQHVLTVTTFKSANRGMN